MTSYNLSRLAAGSYDVLLNGAIIASLARNGSHDGATWSIELLRDLPPSERPKPFLELAHEFSSLEEARLWLGAEMDDPPGRI